MMNEGGMESILKGGYWLVFMLQLIQKIILNFDRGEKGLSWKKQKKVFGQNMSCVLEVFSVKFFPKFGREKI